MRGRIIGIIVRSPGRGSMGVAERSMVGSSIIIIIRGRGIGRVGVVSWAEDSMGNAGSVLKV